MGKKYYHNVTQKRFNETEYIDLLEEMNEGDYILYSLPGCATIFELQREQLEQLQKDLEEFYIEDDLIN